MCGSCVHDTCKWAQTQSVYMYTHSQFRFNCVHWSSPVLPLHVACSTTGNARTTCVMMRMKSVVMVIWFASRNAVPSARGSTSRWQRLWRRQKSIPTLKLVKRSQRTSYEDTNMYCMGVVYIQWCIIACVTLAVNVY